LHWVSRQKSIPKENIGIFDLNNLFLWFKTAFKAEKQESTSEKAQVPKSALSLLSARFDKIRHSFLFYLNISFNLLLFGALLINSNGIMMNTQSTFFAAASARRLLAIGLFLSMQSIGFGQILINEYSAANWKQFTDNFGVYEDWIELYNNSSQAVNLGGWSLTDNPANADKWVFAAGVNIPANGFLRVWCSGRDTVIGVSYHTNFKLTQTKGTPEKLTLSNASGNIVDQIEVKKTATHQSRCRNTDGENLWKICTQPSPNTSNNLSKKFDRFLDRPEMDKDAGFYADSVLVSISTQEPDAVIRYTTNGHLPTDTSNLYTGPIMIKETTVLKAMVFSSDTLALPSLIRFNTYFINVDHTMVVVSIGADNVIELANGDQGLRPVGSFEYFGKDKLIKDHAYGELNSHGQDSWANDQRSLDWISRDEFGYSAAVEEKIYTGSTRDKFQRIILRASGDDNYPAAHNAANEGSAHMRDDYVQTLAHLGNLHLDVRKSERCIVYLNGQYWGVYSFREKIDDHDYTDYYYKQGKYDIQMVLTWGNTWSEYGGSKSITEWKAMRSYILNNNMADTAKYAIVENQMDMLSLIDYVFVNSNSVCSDWLNYNTGWWRGKNPDGDHKKWGYILWDNDATFGFYINYTGIPNITPTAGPCDITEINNSGDPERHIDILTKLRSNPKFDQLYLSRYADLNNTTYSCQNMLHVLDSMTAVIQPEMTQHAARWFGTYTEWEQNILRLRNYVAERCALSQSLLADCYTLTGPFQIHYKVEPPTKGSIVVNTLPASSVPFTNSYFGNMYQKLTAIPAPATGYVFSHWEAKNTVFSLDSTQQNVQATTTATDTVTAHFKLFSSVFAPDELSGVAVYPTLFQDHIYLSLNMPERAPVSVAVLSSVGQQLISYNLGEVSGTYLEQIALPNEWPAGIYLVQVQSGQAVKTLKIVKE
jgi:hypothetical protein